MMTRRQVTLAFAAALTGFAAKKEASGRIRFCRVPQGGIQPQLAVDEEGTLHLVYYTGDAHRGDLFYVRSKDSGMSFSPAMPVKRRFGSDILWRARRLDSTRSMGRVAGLAKPSPVRFLSHRLFRSHPGPLGEGGCRSNRARTTHTRPCVSS